MAERQIHLSPKDTYVFKQNASYGADWSLLKDNDAQRMIAQQLTHLDFLQWLRDNVKYEDNNGHLRPLWLHPAEGIIKTLVVTYAAIAELALFSIANRYYAKHQKGSPTDVVSCFECSDMRYYEFSAREVTTELNNQAGVVTKLYGRVENTKKVHERDVTFDKLIKAGKAIKLYDAAFAQRLNVLRDYRNGVHLKKHIKMQDGKNFAYESKHIIQAKQVVDDLRLKIASFCY
jgi:hypothetical protein